MVCPRIQKDSRVSMTEDGAVMLKERTSKTVEPASSSRQLALLGQGGGTVLSDGMDVPYHGVMCARAEFGYELQTEGGSTMDNTTNGC